MEGVNILYSWNYSPMIIIFIICVFIFVGLGVYLDIAYEKYKRIEIPTIILLIIISIIGISSMFLFCVGEERYAITLDNNVAYEELTTKYQIIDQKGQILIVEEKDIEESE